MTITINKNLIYGEVARASLYTGAKHPGADSALISRVAVIDADRALLGRFVDEALETARLALRQTLESVSADADTITLTLSLSQASDDTQTAGIADSLTGYIAKAVMARWLSFSDKTESEACAAEARTLLDDCLRKALYKRKPKRPNY